MEVIIKHVVRCQYVSYWKSLRKRAFALVFWYRGPWWTFLYFFLWRVDIHHIWPSHLTLIKTYRYMYFRLWSSEDLGLKLQILCKNSFWVLSGASNTLFEPSKLLGKTRNIRPSTNCLNFLLKCFAKSA